MHIDIWLLWLPLILIWIASVVTQEEKPLLRLGVVLPSNRFWRRQLQSAISYPLLQEVIFSDKYNILIENYTMIRNGNGIKDKMLVKLFMEAPEDPATVYNYICQELLDKQVNTLFFLRNDDNRGVTASTTNFIMNYANSIGIPVIAWIGDASGLAQTSADSIVIQMTPSVTHQCKAMFALLERYNWRAFTIMTTTLSGHDHFINTLRELVDMSENKDVEVLSVIRVTSLEEEAIDRQLDNILDTESRVILLYASSIEALKIFEIAEKKGMTDAEFTWIVSRTIVVGSHKLPAGLLGIDFEKTKETTLEELESVLELCVKVWAQAMKNVMEDGRRENRTVDLVPNFKCDNAKPNVWKEGTEMYNKMINVSLEYDDDKVLEFNQDGTMKHTSLSIMNFVPIPDTNKKRWKKIGNWQTSKGLHIEAIYWPGDTPLPPKGRPAKYHIRVVTLKEDPYVIYSNPDPDTGQCSSQSYPCRIASLNETRKYKNATRDPNLYQCCSGFCMDLLNLLAEDIGFNFELFQVEDKIWGALNKQTGEWEGLVKALIDHEADMSMTSLKITPERNSAVDFSVPFLETGISIIVAVRDGVITPTAFLKPFDQQCWIFILLMCIQVLAVAVFLFEWMSPNGFNLQKHPPREPYDYPSWCLILVFSVHACGAAIFIFEWLSPSGLDRGTKPIREHKFSLFRSFWLIWAMLFGAAVNVDNPRGVSSRFLANIWALFAVVFTASYTANLATFMITKDDYDRLTGIDDAKLQYAHELKPPFKFGTIPKGSTDVNLRNNFPHMSEYMNKNQYNYEDVTKGVKALKDGDLNAFIYDATVLEYKASHDEDCKLKTVGNWYAMTGYGVGFPKNSKWLPRVNHVLRRLQYEGTLERLQKFWLAGACKYKSDEEGQSTSTQLGILNFTSAFILLASGMLLGGLLLLLEHIYFKFFRSRLRKIDKCGCCGLISLSMGKSLTFEQSVREAIELQKHHKCKNPVCETHTWKLKHELDLALLKVERLNKQLSDNGMVPDRRAVWRRPLPSIQPSAPPPPAIGWKNELIPNHRNSASPPSSARHLHNRATSPGYNRLDNTHYTPMPYVGSICEHNRLDSPPRNIPPPSTPPSAWQQQPKTFDYPPQPHSMAGVQPESSLPYQPPPEPYYCTPVRQPIKSQQSEQNNKKGSKSLPSSPVKQRHRSSGYGGGGSGSEREDSPHRYHQQQQGENMTRTTSFPESPRRRTRMHQGNMYMSVNRSEPHICEKETVL